MNATPDGVSQQAVNETGPNARAARRQGACSISSSTCSRLWAVQLGADDVACQLESPTAQQVAWATRPARRYKAALPILKLARSRPECAASTCCSSDSVSVQVSALYSRMVSITTWNNAALLANERQHPGKPTAMSKILADAGNQTAEVDETADKAEALSPVHQHLAHKIGSLDVVRHAEHDGPPRVDHQAGTRRNSTSLSSCRGGALDSCGQQGEIVSVAKHAEPPLRLTSTHASRRNRKPIVVALASDFVLTVGPRHTACCRSVPTRGHGAYPTAHVDSSSSLGTAQPAILPPQWWFRLVKPADQPELLCYGPLAYLHPASLRSGPARRAAEYPVWAGAPRPRTRRVRSSAGSAGASSSQQSAWFGLGHKLRLMLPYVWPSSSPLLQLRVVACVLLLACGRVINCSVPIYSNGLADPGRSRTAPPTRAAWRGDRRHSNYILRLKSEPAADPVAERRVDSDAGIPLGSHIDIFVALKTAARHWQLRSSGSHWRCTILSVDRVTVHYAGGFAKLFNHLHLYILFNIAPTLFDISIGMCTSLAGLKRLVRHHVFATIGPVPVLSIVINRMAHKRTLDAVDSLLNFETVKYYAAEGYENERFRKRLRRPTYISSQTLNLLNSVQNFIINIGFTGGALLCAYYIVQRANGNPEVPALTVGDYVLTYIMQLYVPLNWFATAYYRMIQQTVYRYGEYAEVADHPDAVDLNLGEATLSLRPAKPVLKSVTSQWSPGQTVALVGQSGAGKSSILRLLFRFYDVQSGQILIDGKDIRRVTPEQSQTGDRGLCRRDTALFNADIRYNIRYGRPDASDAELASEVSSSAAARKQRVAIARTLLKGPRIVLLDEATSALDTATERNIQASLDRVCSGRTTLVVAHRLSTIVGADVILVLHDGEIVERGSHDALVQSGGLYAGMWRQQKLESDELAKENETAEISFV
uniref:ABC transmembrane type-1 domain-containing protein n=1 Tax=Macrostomum lignano TaxID=282301 RepID=A0A1I8FIA6_9PLAT